MSEVVMLRLFIIAFMSVIIYGCGSYPQKPEDQATFHANEAKIAITKGDSVNAAREIDAALSRPTGEYKVKQLFSSNPSGEGYYISFLNNSISQINYIIQASDFHSKLSKLQSSNLLPQDSVTKLFESLNSHVLSGNLSDGIEIYLGDDISKFPALASKDHQDAILERSIKQLQSSSGKRKVSELMDYVRAVGIDSPEGQRVESLLPSMGIKRNELDIVSTNFPDFAAARAKEIVARVFFTFDGGDRITREEILDVFNSKIKGVEWLSSDSPDAIRLKITQERYSEKSTPERMETVVYAQHQVDILNAALLMPRGASYLYDIFTGGAEIEYGYTISLYSGDDVLHDSIFRGKHSSEYRKCQNARIQNVFGGVTPAEFVANSDMQNRCSGQTEASLDDVRNKVYSDLAAEIVKIPQIQKVHDAN